MKLSIIFVLVVLSTIICAENNSLLFNSLKKKYEALSFKLNWRKSMYIQVVHDLTSKDSHMLASTNYLYMAVARYYDDAVILLLANWILSDACVWQWTESLSVALSRTIIRSLSNVEYFSLCPKLAPFLDVSNFIIFKQCSLYFNTMIDFFKINKITHIERNKNMLRSELSTRFEIMFLSSFFHEDQHPLKHLFAHLFDSNVLNSYCIFLYQNSNNHNYDDNRKQKDNDVCKKLFAIPYTKLLLVSSNNNFLIDPILEYISNNNHNQNTTTMILYQQFHHTLKTRLSSLLSNRTIKAIVDLDGYTSKISYLTHTLYLHPFNIPVFHYLGQPQYPLGSTGFINYFITDATTVNAEMISSYIAINDNNNDNNCNNNNSNNNNIDNNNNFYDNHNNNNSNNYNNNNNSNNDNNKNNTINNTYNANAKNHCMEKLLLVPSYYM